MEVFLRINSWDHGDDLIETIKEKFKGQEDPEAMIQIAGVKLKLRFARFSTMTSDIDPGNGNEKIELKLES